MIISNLRAKHPIPTPSASSHLHFFYTFYPTTKYLRPLGGGGGQANRRRETKKKRKKDETRRDEKPVPSRFSVKKKRKGKGGSSTCVRARACVLSCCGRATVVPRSDGIERPSFQLLAFTIHARPGLPTQSQHNPLLTSHMAGWT